MNNRKVRIGIDVGGTFTDAVAIDNDTYEIIAKVKIPTTHDKKEGVAKGIVDVINRILLENNIKPDDVVFIAHGTTQATNALLEGDIDPVGIIGMGKGFETFRIKQETNVKNIELAPGKFLKVEHKFFNSDKIRTDSNILNKTLEQLKKENINVVVASEAYSVDDPTNEQKVLEIGKQKGMYVTAGHEITKLYGLKRRTRTAVVNGSLIPRMMETANMTESCVKRADIKTPLMIMRCDGGVMSIDEVRERPILTMLSGLAAGVAGALMYEKISDGIFFEVGGTSTDISVIKNGKVMLKYAQVGGHKTYLNSLDVRTLGLAGGSMIKIENNKIVDVGPRSAHIAGKKYEVFVDDGTFDRAEVEFVSPKPDDPKSYICVKGASGETYSYTLAGAANILGSVPDGDYASGNIEEAKKAWKVLADLLGKSVEETAEDVMKIACSKVGAIVKKMVHEYELSPSMIKLVGGGGSGGVLVPYLAENMGYKWTVAQNAPYISTIGVALAMVREIVERSAVNPTNNDIMKIRQEVLQRIVKSGADENTVEVVIDIDKRNNILRAIATGATEFRAKDLLTKSLDHEKLKKIASDSMDIETPEYVSELGKWHIFKGEKRVSKLFGLYKSKETPIRILDREGIVRLQRQSGYTYIVESESLQDKLSHLIDFHTTYSDAGATIPKTVLLFGEKMVDLSGLINKEQVLALGNTELQMAHSEKIGIIIYH